MTIRGMIFDVDGTLVDTNAAHVEAWCRAFRRLGFQVPTERIVPEIGKGGDKLVPSILGAEAEERLGEELRKAQKEQFLEIAQSQHF
ncbi:MAG TPA: HAD hydrolase-like protein, partial [Gemmatimonadales bacterium]|nr:HAD hydrolase-like protein [Gemmatimonadales bacterium]